MTLGLYIHVPFCLAKCRYCDFISYPYTETAAVNYLDCLLQEIALYGRDLPQEEKRLGSIFIGGGTPTCLPVAGLRRILRRVRESFYLLPDCEITLEANPGTVDRPALEQLRESGVNRLSLGIQAFQDNVLAVLGRIHTATEAVAAVQAARAAGFENLNLDFIYGVPGQTEADWLDTLHRVADLAPEHVAVYGLQLEPGTPLEQEVSSGALEACSEDLELLMYRTAIDFLTVHGYGHYEISNFARPGKEAAHNLRYWLNQPYLGLGPAAHSYLHGERFANTPSLESYAVGLAQGKPPLSEREVVTVRNEMAETMFMGLRLRKGVGLDAFYRRFGQRAEEVYRTEIVFLQKAGLLEIVAGHLRLTTKGLPVGNEVFKEFVD